MTKIIRGKRYSSKAAIKHGSISRRSLEYSDDYIFTLCQRRKGGDFFLYGRSKEINGYTKKPVCESIMPMTTRDAMEWARGQLSDDEYKSIFGEAREDSETPSKV